MTWFAMLVVLLLQVPAPPTSIWPVTVAGWITLVVALVSPFAFAFGAGRVYAKLNGYGARLAKVEKRLAEHEGGMAEVRTAMQNILGAQAALMEKIGEATRSSISCNQNTEALAKRIHDQLDALDRKVTDSEHETALELRGLTTELRTRGYIGPEGRNVDG